MSFDPYAYDLAQVATRPALAGVTLAEQTLLAVPEEARRLLRRGLLEAIAGPLDLWERTPAGRPRQPPPFNIQHAGKLYFHPAALRQQTRENWHRLMGIELRLAAQMLEALLIDEDTAIYRARLAEQCGRIGQLYNELKRRVGEALALALFQWEVRILRYRASAVVGPLIYD
jgi:hypothetical protein